MRRVPLAKWIEKRNKRGVYGIAALAFAAVLALGLAITIGPAAAQARSNPSGLSMAYLERSETPGPGETATVEPTETISPTGSTPTMEPRETPEPPETETVEPTRTSTPTDTTPTVEPRETPEPGETETVEPTETTTPIGSTPTVEPSKTPEPPETETVEPTRTTTPAGPTPTVEPSATPEPPTTDSWSGVSGSHATLKAVAGPEPTAAVIAAGTPGPAATEEPARTTDHAAHTAEHVHPVRQDEPAED